MKMNRPARLEKTNPIKLVDAPVVGQYPAHKPGLSSAEGTTCPEGDIRSIQLPLDASGDGEENLD